MALETVIIDVSLATGLAEQVDSRMSPQGTFLTLQNYVYNRAGALEKRPGYVELTRATLDDATPPTALRFDLLGGDLVTYGEDLDGRERLYVFGKNAQEWKQSDIASRCSMKRSPQIRYPLDVKQPFISRAGGQEVTTWGVRFSNFVGANQGGTFLRSTDLATGATLIPALQINNDVVPMLSFACGDRVFMVGTDDATAHINLHRFDPATLTIDLFSGGPAIASPLVIDACPLPDGSGFLVAYTVVDRASPNPIHVFKYDTDLTLLFAHTITPVGLCEHLAVGTDNSRCGVIYSDEVAGTINVIFETFSAVTLSAPAGPVLVGPVDVVVALAVGVDAAANFFAYISFRNTTGTGDLGTACRQFTPLAVPTAVQPRFLYNVALASRPCLILGRLYGLVTGALVCLDGSESELVPFELESVVAPGEWAAEPGVSEPRFFLSYDSQTKLAVSPIIVRTQASGAIFGADRVVFDFGEPRWLSAEAQSCLHVAGGFLGSFDGIRNVEHGFVQSPKLTLGTIHAGTGGIAGDTPPNRYEYVACYEWVDEVGNVHRSDLSNAVIADVDTAHDNATIDLNITCTQLTRRLIKPGRAVRIAIFRTLKNAPEQLFRIAAFGAGPLNQQNAGSTTTSDSLDDAALQGSRFGLIYTDGGILPANAVPAMNAVVSHKNRLFGAIAEDGRQVWFTRTFTRAEAPAWHPGLSFRIDDSPDEIMALASIDDKLLIFTPTRVYWVNGDGPNDNGTAGSFSEPFLLTTGSGCIDPRSVISYDGGVFYRDDAGLMRIDRSLSVSFAGAPVQSTVEGLPLTRSVVKDAARQRLIWLMSATDEFAAAFVVFDYLHNAWSTWFVEVGGFSFPYSQAIFQGKHVFAAASAPAHFWQESGALDPGGNWPQGVIETPWIRLAAIGGYQRVRRVQLNGRKISGHTMTVEVSQDNSDNTIQSVTWDNGDGYHPPNPPTIRRELHVRQQKVSAIKLRFVDGPSGGASEARLSGQSVVGISLEIGALKGRAKLGQKRLEG